MAVVASRMITLVLLMMGAAPLSAAEWVQESPGQKAYYDAEGQLQRLEIDADKDGRFEVEERYANRQRVKRLEDLDGDGTWERCFTWKQDGSAVLREEGHDGKVKLTSYGPDGTIRRIEKDSAAGVPGAVWEYRAGKLHKVSKPGGIWTYRDGQLDRAEIFDKRGRVERIEYFNVKGAVDKVEELTADGQVRRRLFYDRQRQPLRIEEDWDGDGKMERRREFKKNGITETLIDANLDGVAEIRERYGADGRFISRQEDLDGDGVYDLRTGQIKEN